MNINLYKEFIQELKNQGINVKELLVSQISESIKLYKIIHG